ncbi:MAG: hypothetical protein HC837_10255 [Chloroflexaceae bacterium]|nr:hypothetical protein [Chloroflexaceae bacterium]
MVAATERLFAQEQAPDVDLSVKIGHMLMMGFRGTQIDTDHHIVRDIQKYHIGGVILFSHYAPDKVSTRNNIQSATQLQALIATLQSFAPTPLLVAIDYEGGQVSRLNEDQGFPPTVSHGHLGELNDLANTRSHATIMARTLAQLGINLNLAPVVDLNTNPKNPVIARFERSFSGNADLVTRHAVEFIKAHAEQGIFCTLKHFPGHGSSTNDSHLGFTDITNTWSVGELKPYSKMIKANLADVIMTAHVFHSGMDDTYPATLSRAILTDMLRHEMGYDGVILTDDLQMKAITNFYGFDAAIQHAIEAGVDMIMLANIADYYDADLAVRAVNVIEQLVRDGIISEQRIDQSYRRIARLKQRLQENPTLRVTDPQSPDVLYFPETGHTLHGIFLNYWLAHGGLAMFGFPLTREFAEQGITVQYFERVRFEYHPGATHSVGTVMLGVLGREAAEARHGELPFEPAIKGVRKGRYFPETGHHLSPLFEDYWDEQGGLALFGYPISEPFRDVSQIDGHPYLVQYFERVRLEHHPEHAGTPYVVIPGMLGLESLRARGWID